MVVSIIQHLVPAACGVEARRAEPQACNAKPDHNSSFDSNAVLQVNESGLYSGIISI